MGQEASENINADLIDKTLKKNDIYRLFKDNAFLKGNNPPKLRHTKSKDSESLSSLQFDADCLKDVFNLNCKNFCRKYTEAISGLEEDNIFTLHSSSLLALLFFCGVSRENPIYIAGQRYNHVHFEHKNPIPFESTKNGKTRKYTTNSNIDVVLSDKETLEDSEQILFLESKFTEYTHNAQESDISLAAYGKIYDALGDTLKAIGLEFNNGILSRKDKNDKGHYYCEGIKQMICHFMGAQNFAGESKNKHKNIKLGCIIYDLGILDKLCNQKNNDKYGKIFESYKKQFKILITGLKEIKTSNNLILMPEILTYQNLYHKNPNCINDTIKDFYRLDEKEQ